jgi:hypothetical protein
VANTNTGNAQNAIDVVQVGGDADDFEFDDVVLRLR